MRQALASNMGDISRYMIQSSIRFEHLSKYENSVNLLNERYYI